MSANPTAVSTLTLTVEGEVAVGEITAAILSEKLGREVKPGEVFEIGELHRIQYPNGSDN